MDPMLATMTYEVLKFLPRAARDVFLMVTKPTP